MRVLNENGEKRTSDDPTEAIQSTLNSIAEGDDRRRIVAVDGTFDISSRLEVPGGVFLDLGTAELVATGNHSILALRGVSDATVLGGVLDGSGQADGSEFRSVISLNRAERAAVVGTEIKNGGYYGLNIYECNDCFIARVRAHDNHYTGVHPGTDEEGWGLDNVFAGCSAYNNGYNGISDRGTTVPQQLHNTYLNCQSWNNDRNGLLFGNGIDSDDPDINYHVVECRSFGNGLHGIRIANANAAVTNPTAERNARAGILLGDPADVTILNPTVRNNSGADNGGIVLQREDDDTRPNVVVYGGTVTDNERNLFVRSAHPDARITFRDVEARGGRTANVVFGDQRPRNVTIDNVAGFRTEAKGSQSRTVDGSRSFSWEHGLDAAPETVNVQPRNQAAAGDFFVDADDRTITVTYAESPDTEGDEVAWWWRATAF